MKKLLFNNSKWLYFALGIIAALIIISSLFFMNQYKFVRVNYNVEEGVKTYVETAKLNGANQVSLFTFIDNLGSGAYGLEENHASQALEVINNNGILTTLLKKDGNELVNFTKIVTVSWGEETVKYTFTNDIFTTIENFRNSLDSFNNLILIYGIVTLLTFAGLLILSNHSRKIYYKSNLFGGILLPLINVIFVVVLLIQGLGLMGTLSDANNNAVFNVVSAIQNPAVATNVDFAASEETNLLQINNIISAFNVNSTTVIVYTVFFVLTAVYNVFLMVFAVMKYNATAKERKEVLDRARMVGENA